MPDFITLPQAEQSEYFDAAEDSLLSLFSQPQSQIEEKIQDMFSPSITWEMRYHLSPRRKMLLDWFPFSKSATLLEIGAGCGALTGMLTQKVKHVFANELTEKRCRVIQKRYSDIKNLTIIQGNIQQFTTSVKFDYVTLIGVLEYSGKFMSNGTGESIYDPYLKMLSTAKSYLKKGGTLLIAIENKLGLKYLAGGKEDHYGNSFSSIENYPNYSGIRTFSKRELTKLLVRSGFKNSTFYYPFPDYKTPDNIFSDESLHHLNFSTSTFLPIVDYSHERVPIFNEVMFGHSLQEERILEIFANSFLVVATL